MIADRSLLLVELPAPFHGLLQRDFGALGTI
jgi:hypothetical protein